MPGIQNHSPGILIYTFVHAGLDSLSGVPLSQACADVQLLLEELQQLFSFDAAKNDPRKVHRQSFSCDVMWTTLLFATKHFKYVPCKSHANIAALALRLCVHVYAKMFASIQAAASLRATVDDTCTAESLELPKLVRMQTLMNEQFEYSAVFTTHWSTCKS